MPPTTQVKESSNSLLIPLAIVVAGAMVALAIYFGGGTSSGQKTATDNTAQEAVIENVGAQDRIFGNANAQIKIVEYSDLECPFCKVFHERMHQVVSEYNGKVAWVFRHFPIEQLHSKAIKEAEASECAFDQGGNTVFWKYIDKVFSTTQSNNSLDPKMLPQIASDLGLNVSLFNECLNTGKYTQKIADDVVKAIDAGARGTPYSVIINARGEKSFINGAEPIESIRVKIDAALK